MRKSLKIKESVCNSCKWMVVVMAILLLGGCATVPKYTPMVETSLTMGEVKRSFLDQLTAKGGIIVEESAHVLVIDLSTTGFNNFWHYNVVTGERPKERYRFNFVDLGERRRITAFAAHVHSPGLAGPVEEDRTDIRSLGTIQNGLENLIAVAEGKEPPHASKRPNNLKK